jgi:type I restriction enzyme, S subunit
MTSFTQRTLGDICDEVNGIIRTGPFGSQLHQSDYSETGTPVVMPKDLVEGKISTESVARVDQTHVERLSQHKLIPGDIVYARRGDIGRRAFVSKREAGWLCGTGCLRISLGSSVIDPMYLHYYLGQPDVIEWIFKQAVGATMPNLNTSIIRSIPVSYPQLSVQRKITAVLSAYDDLIENNTRRIAILEEMAQRLYREWFVHFRFPGHEAVPLVGVNGGDGGGRNGRLPEGWRLVRLEEICDLTLGQSPPSTFYNEDGEGLPFHQGVADFGSRFPTDRVYCTQTKRTAEAGDILFSVRAPVGRINIARRKIVIGRGLHAIRSKTGHQGFIFQQLKDKFHEEDMMGGGTIFKSVTKSDMLNLQLIFPTAALADAFEAQMRPIFRQLEILFDKNANLRQTRDLLLPRLISGQLDLSTRSIQQT